MAKMTAMPLLTLNELESVAPAFRGKAGNAFARLLMKALAVDKVNDLYDRNSSLEGPAFAEAVLKDIDQALRWLTASAKQGNQYAQYTLGKLYLLGKEVPREEDAAVH